jgi:hypothetical protein
MSPPEPTIPSYAQALLDELIAIETKRGSNQGIIKTQGSGFILLSLSSRCEPPAVRCRWRRSPGLSRGRHLARAIGQGQPR